MAIDKDIEMCADLLRRIQQHEEMIVELKKLYKEYQRDYLQNNLTQTENDFNQACEKLVKGK